MIVHGYNATVEFRIGDKVMEKSSGQKYLEYCLMCEALGVTDKDRMSFRDFKMKEGSQDEKEYFFEHSFVRLSWDKILKAYPWARYVTIGFNGHIVVSKEKPYINVSRWHLDGGPRELIANLATKFDNWKSLVWEAPTQEPEIDRAVLEALKVLGFKWIAQDKDGLCFAYRNEPDIDERGEQFVSEETNLKGFAHLDIPHYSGSWRDSLRYIDDMLEDNEVPARIIEELRGKGFKWIAQDEDGDTYTYMDKPYIDGYAWMAKSNDRYSIVPTLESYCEDWLKSLRYIG